MLDLCRAIDPAPQWNYVWPYARASKQVQEASPSVQVERILRWWEFRQPTLGDKYRLHEPLIDKATTSRTCLFDRPYGQVLKLQLRPGDIVVVTKNDRAFRNFRESINVVEDWLGLGINFVCLHMDLDTSTSTGKLVFRNLAAVAEFERDSIAERTMEGLQWRREHGFAVTGPPWGWSNKRQVVSGVTVSIRVPNELERAAACLCAYLRDQRGMTWAEIGRVNWYLGIKSRRSDLLKGHRQTVLYGYYHQGFVAQGLDPLPELDARLYGQIEDLFDPIPTVALQFLAKHGHLPNQQRTTFVFRDAPQLVPGLRVAS